MRTKFVTRRYIIIILNEIHLSFITLLFLEFFYKHDCLYFYFLCQEFKIKLRVYLYFKRKLPFFIKIIHITKKNII